MVVGVLFVAAKPVIAKIQAKLDKGLKGGIFKDDPAGGQFY